MQDAGCRMQDAGCGMQVAGCGFGGGEREKKIKITITLTIKIKKKNSARGERRSEIEDRCGDGRMQDAGSQDRGEFGVRRSGRRAGCWMRDRGMQVAGCRIRMRDAGRRMQV
jgi:hypothetical protein